MMWRLMIGVSMSNYYRHVSTSRRGRIGRQEERGTGVMGMYYCQKHGDGMQIYVASRCQVRFQTAVGSVFG